MPKRKGNDKDRDDVPELTAAAFKRMRPAREVHPKIVDDSEQRRDLPPKEVGQPRRTAR